MGFAATLKQETNSEQHNLKDGIHTEQNHQRTIVLLSDY